MEGDQMTETYDQNKDVHAEAAEAAIRAIALYKAAGYKRAQFETFPVNFWKITPAAVPAPAPTTPAALLHAAALAAVTIDAVYQWLDRVEKAGGATTISAHASVRCSTVAPSIAGGASSWAANPPPSSSPDPAM